MNTDIDGMKIIPLEPIKDERGAIYHMMREDTFPFMRFGEIYFSKTYPNVIKAWKLHTKQIQNICVPVGKILFVIYDPRHNSPTYGNLLELKTGSDEYELIHIPANLYYGWKCISEDSALVAACPESPHDPAEAVIIPKDSEIIPYKWNDIS